MTWKTKAAAGVALATLAVLGIVKVVRQLEAEAPYTKPGGAPETGPKILSTARPFVAPAEAKASLPPEKKARLDQIRRDYAEIRAKMVQDYGAAGEKFPGGVSAFLRQLALLEREMHADFAKTLTPEELEDYELQESNTGKTVRQRTADLALTDEQTRTIYRVQREFDDRFSLVFDVSPAALLERLKVQRVAREKIRAALSDEAYARWLRAEDPSYLGMRTVAQNQGLAASAINDLWRIKDEWTQRKLEIAADPRLAPEQRTSMQAALAGQTRSQVLALVGDHAVVSAIDAFNWLPPAP